MMAAPYRKNSMMAMLDAKPEAKGGNGQSGQNNGQQFWNDVNADDQLSPLRKHLISTYLQVSDEDAMPLLSEYFGVALSFVALGALLRSSNSSKKRHKKGVLTPEDERLDLQACSRFERMALESMLKESMERLGSLSQNAYQLECRVRDLVDENVARDKEKVQLLKRVAEGDKVVQELKALRRAEGRANERVMSIVAAKEQDWLKEKRNLQKEIEKLKETVNGMTREAKFQARRCRNPTCEHCKGIDKVVRTVKGRISLRELHSSRDSAQSNGRRESPKLGHPVETPKVERLEIEEDRVLMKAIELKKKHKEHQSKVERLHQSEGSAEIGSSQAPSKELLLKQQHDMESELANILKRVGMLKQKSYLTSGPSTSKEAQLAMEEMHLPADNNGALEHPMDEFSPDRNRGEENTEKDPLITFEPNMDDPTLEVADCTTDQGESDLIELEKAFEMEDADETSSPPQDNRLLTGNAGDSSSSSPPRDNHLATDNTAENVEAQPELHEIVNGEISSTIKEQQWPPVVGDELVQLQENLRNEDGLVSFPFIGNASNEGLDEDTGNSGAVISDAVADPIGEGETCSPMQVLKGADAQEQEFTSEAATKELQAEDSMREAGLQSDRSLDSSRPDSESTSLAETPESASAESSYESFPDSESTGLAETPESASAESTNESTSLAETSESASAESTNESRPDSKSTSLAETSESASAESTNESRPDSESASLAETSESASAESSYESFPDSERNSVAKTSESASAESANEDEQVGEFVEDEDIPEFADALCLPLDPVTFSASEDMLPSSSLVSEQNDYTEYDTGKDVKENWDFEDSVPCCSEGELLENQDIPVFERNDIEDDLAGELPEPEEKRVCGLETTNELLSVVKETSCQEGCERLVEKDNAAIEGVVNGQQEEGPLVEKVAMSADVKPKSEAVVEQS